MIDITTWLNEFTDKLNSEFQNRIWFMGLQGSYPRGEADENSDIDIVVIFDELTLYDIKKYNEMLDTLPYRSLICGFISGKNELLNWEPSDLFQFYHDTVPIKGSLDDLLPFLDENSVDRAIKIGVCNIYHGCVHNALHEKNDEILKGLYKNATFVIRAICFKQTARYIKSKNDLFKAIPKDEQEIINIFSAYKKGNTPDFTKATELLFGWCKKHINN